MPRTDSTRFSPNTPWEDMGCPGQIAPFFNNTLWEETPPAAADGLIQRLPTMPKMQKIKMSSDFLVLNRKYMSGPECQVIAEEQFFSLDHCRVGKNLRLWLGHTSYDAALRTSVSMEAQVIAKDRWYVPVFVHEQQFLYAIIFQIQKTVADFFLSANF